MEPCIPVAGQRDLAAIIRYAKPGQPCQCRCSQGSQDRSRRYGPPAMHLIGFTQISGLVTFQGTRRRYGGWYGRVPMRRTTNGDGHHPPSSSSAPSLLLIHDIDVNLYAPVAHSNTILFSVNLYLDLSSPGPFGIQAISAMLPWEHLYWSVIRGTARAVFSPLHSSRHSFCTEPQLLPALGHFILEELFLHLNLCAINL